MVINRFARGANGEPGTGDHRFQLGALLGERLHRFDRLVQRIDQVRRSGLKPGCRVDQSRDR
ncbi:Uncharacterised protein [Mycobacteroides abscessus subsp. abscessus]|nr:Uncharacterised protein [Mycobacteroides abscessus subsp. abscessus]